MHEKSSRRGRSVRLVVPIAAVAVALGVPLIAGVAAAQEGPPGNNGTVKVDGLPFDEHPDNEPHPGCEFDIDWYNFDANATSEVTFESQNPTGTDILLTDSVTLDDDANEGGDEDGLDDLDAQESYTLEFTEDDFFHPNQGYHVKLTIETTWSNGAEVKHKVFWVSECEAGGGTTTTTPPSGTSTETTTTTTTTTTATTPPTVGGGGGTNTTSVGGKSGQNTSSPGGLAFTGPEDVPWLIAATVGLLLAGTLALRLGSRPVAARDSDWRT
jgi:hypothetical protein